MAASFILLRYVSSQLASAAPFGLIWSNELYWQAGHLKRTNNLAICVKPLTIAYERRQICQKIGKYILSKGSDLCIDGLQGVLGGQILPRDLKFGMTLGWFNFFFWEIWLGQCILLKFLMNWFQKCQKKFFWTIFSFASSRSKFT